MKKLFTLWIAVTLCFPVMATDSASGIEISKRSGEVLHIASTAIRSLSFADGNAVITSQTGESCAIPTADIISIASIRQVATEYSVTFTGERATVCNPYALLGVSTDIDGNYVTTFNTNETEELTFALSGTTGDGGYLYYGTHKCTLRLDGVNISSRRGAAIDVRCGKRIAVVLAEGTVNTLSDFAEGEQKAALYFKGHAEFEKSGALWVYGNCNHAISSKEYILLKKSAPEIKILSAVADGIHADQYFQMNGGSVTIAQAGGDGIQASLTDDETDEQNGQIVINGGRLDINVVGPTSDALKADQLISITGGELHLLTTGDGIQTATNTVVSGPGGGWGGGGNPPGGGSSSSVDCSSPKCVNGKGDICITGGSIVAKSTGKGGKCIVADGTLTIGSADAGPSIECTTSGSAVAGSGDNLSGCPKAIKAEGDITITGGRIVCTTSGSGGEGIESKSRITITGGTVACATSDDGINASKKITVQGGIVWSWSNGNDGMDCNGSEGFEFNGGIIVSNGKSSPEEGFDCDSYSFVIGGGIVLGVGGAASGVTKATQPYASTSGLKTTVNTYLSMLDASGNVILSYLCPITLSSATVVSSSPDYTSGASCQLVYGVTAVSNPTATYLDGRIVLGGTLTGGTSKTITPKTK